MIKILLILMLLLNSSEIFSQNESADLIIKKIQSKFLSIEDLKADFSQKVNGNSNYELNGKFFYKKKKGYRLEVLNKVLLNDGNSIYNIDNSQKKIVISPIDEGTTSFSIDKIINQYPADCNARKINESAFNIVELNPKSASVPFSKLQIYYSNDYMINKFVLTDFSNLKTEIELKNVIINSNLSNTYFNFNRRSDFEIIDLR